MKGWTHLHSVLGGALLGVALSRNGDWIAAALLIMFLLGLFAGRFWAVLAELVRRLFHHEHPVDMKTAIRLQRHILESRRERHPW